jgi:hypothetical protein
MARETPGESPVPCSASLVALSAGQAGATVPIAQGWPAWAAGARVVRTWPVSGPGDQALDVVLEAVLHAPLGRHGRL